MNTHAAKTGAEPYPDIAKLGTILGIWAHPDDESWTAAGILAMAVANGQRVVCITATRGEAGQTADENRWPQAQLSTIREQELKAALASLGIKEHLWLHNQAYRDGELATIDMVGAAQEISNTIADVNPDTILTFGPEGLTGHPDHQVMSSLTNTAVEFTQSKATIYWARQEAATYEAYGKTCDAKFNIFFNIDKPPLVSAESADLSVQLPPQIFEQKISALQAQASQMHAFFADEESRACFYPMMAQECFTKATL